MNPTASSRIAIVTGAARGIGAAIAQALAEASWRVAGVDRAWPEGESACAYSETLDVTDYEAVADFVARLEAEGEIGLLVNNAGITRDAIAHKMDPADFRLVLEVNLVGPFNACRAVLPGMRARNAGKIVSLTSMNALRGAAGQANYAAAKAGLIGMTKSIALENAGKGITVNCIAPGYIETEMTRAIPSQLREAELARIPAGRVGTPEDIAGTVVFLASPAADFITGQVISVNGGQLMP
ncbi:SDR family NAD(P)-dependent oxidoreductase [Rhizobium sp. G21]|uniref:SDR family NAD(P)-dependent oxidoreductase n=1 Tax=Rhizobium sp. G21 TaxID=2758439 RepID=UPI00160219F6|nr:3-oxoacyl-ACP reductase FabG [Rhizobium sp. G21]MBB1251017.1 3-oxoacyl-ACP reductase FabG [Rhizobium sp. G21]